MTGAHCRCAAGGHRSRLARAGAHRLSTAANAGPVPVTSLDGYEMMPSLSPDGNQVAFAWNGDKDRIERRYLRVDAGNAGRAPPHDATRRWTCSRAGRPTAARSPSSASGRTLPGACTLISPLGGPERKLSDFDAHFDRVGVWSTSHGPRMDASLRRRARRRSQRGKHRHLSHSGRGWRAACSSPGQSARERSGSCDLARWSSARLLLVRQLLLGRL